MATGNINGFPIPYTTEIPASAILVEAGKTLPDWMGGVVGMQDISISGNSSASFTIGAGSRIFLLCTGLANGLNGIYGICSNSSGAVSAYTIVAASSITLTTGTNTLAIANGAGSMARVLAIVVTGTMAAT